MPVPENSRITLPRFLPASFEDVYANNREFDRWAANLPFFVPHIFKSTSIGATTFTTTTWTDYPTAAPFTISNYVKYASWTNIVVRAGLQGQVSNTHYWEIGVRFRSTTTWITVPVVKEYWLTGHKGKSASDHFNLYGEQIVTDLPAGEYTVTLISRVTSGGTATTDSYDDGFLSIIESP